MFEKALDRYNRIRPDGSPLLSMNDLAAVIAERTGREVTQSSIISVRSTFRRIDEGIQNSISFEILKALSEFTGLDYNTLISFYEEKELKKV